MSEITERLEKRHGRERHFGGDRKAEPKSMANESPNTKPDNGGEKLCLA